jgi:hypothetical protein
MGGNIADAYRLTGVYVTRILKDEKLVSCQSSEARKSNCW